MRPSAKAARGALFVLGCPCLHAIQFFLWNLKMNFNYLILSVTSANRSRKRDHTIVTVVQSGRVFAFDHRICNALRSRNVESMSAIRRRWLTPRRYHCRSHSLVALAISVAWKWRWSSFDQIGRLRKRLSRSCDESTIVKIFYCSQ